MEQETQQEPGVLGRVLMVVSRVAGSCGGGCNGCAAAIAGSADTYQSSANAAARLAHNTFKDIGYLSSYYSAPSRLSAAWILLRSPEIFAFIGHGNVYGIMLSEGAFLVTRQIGGTMPEDIYIEDYNLSKAKLHVYITCYAASGSSNLCLSARNSGVKCVIGWNSLLDIQDSFLWNQQFMSRLGQGDTITQARSFANKYKSYAYPDRTVDNKIYGDGSQILK